MGPSLVEQAPTLLDRYQAPQNAKLTAGTTSAGLRELTCGNIFCDAAGKHGAAASARCGHPKPMRQLD